MSHEQINLSNGDFPNPHPDLWRRQFTTVNFDVRPVLEVGTDLDGNTYVQRQEEDIDQDWTDLLTLPNLTYKEQLTRRRRLMRTLSNSISSDSTDPYTRKLQESQRDHLIGLQISEWLIRTEGIIVNRKKDRVDTTTLLEDWIPDNL